MGAILPCCLPCGKAGGLEILCCQGIKVTDYNFTLDALALKPSDFCDVKVDSGLKTSDLDLLKTDICSSSISYGSNRYIFDANQIDLDYFIRFSIDEK